MSNSECCFKILEIFLERVLVAVFFLSPVHEARDDISYNKNGRIHKGSSYLINLIYFEKNVYIFCWWVEV